MQNKKLPALRTAANDYVTIAAQACDKVIGFKELYQKLERSIDVSGKSKSTFTNYVRQLAHLALHYNEVPTYLDSEQVLDYLHLVKSNGTPSASFFKFTVYGMRAACKVMDLPYEQFSLPAIERPNKLPSVLNGSEVKQLIKVCGLLKHRLLLGLCYGCGLRCNELRNLRIGDVDLERRRVHVRQGKGNKDRILPLGDLLSRGVKTYLQEAHPKTFLFEGHNGEALSPRGAQWVMSEAVKKSGVVKEGVSLHTLRHTYATHLLEQGVNIVTIKELLGHAHIDTTMIYLHLASPMVTMAFSPMDTLYTPRA